MKQLRARKLAATLSFATLSAALVGQSQAERTHVLPNDMLPVPGGVVVLGADAKALLEVEAKVQPTAGMQLRDLPRLMSELGSQRVEVAPFFMSKHLVTNAQYKVFVEKTGHRYPYHWWRIGRQDDYDQRIAEINEKISAKENKDLLFWQQNWKDLPWQIPVDNDLPDKPKMDSYPVVYVSWRDAVAYAAWAGMRLPTEAEWVLAANGGSAKQYLWGDELDAVKFERGSRYDKLWPIGKLGERARGPFGHEDLVLHVWEWTNDLGFFAFDGFEDQRKELLRDKLLRDKDNRDVEAVRRFVPPWRGDSVVCKGGCYASLKTDLRIGTRAPLESYQTLAALGFRVAKSEPPALDIAASLIKLDYDMSYFGDGRRPNLRDQVGIERYELSADGGMIEGYHAVSLVPIAFMTDDKKLSMAKIAEATIDVPVVVATLVTTEKLATPALERGIYTVTYRNAGMPDELDKALAEARKALKAAARSKPKEGEAAPASSDEPWAKVLRKYGITDEEALAGDVDFLRIRPGDLKVSTKEHQFLIRDHAGTYVAAVPSRSSMGSDGDYQEKGAKVAVSALEGGGERVSFDFGVPTTDRESRRGYTFVLDLVLPPESAGNGKWRLPGAATATNGVGGSHNVQSVPGGKRK